jgi:putative acetyltransferase
VSDLVIRPVRAEDDPELARIVREGMAEFGICGDGPASDPELASISAAYAPPESAYFVVERGGRVLGGGGIGPIEGQPDTICELRKMYLVPEARGLGAGRRVLESCLQTAREIGYEHCHLATLVAMDRARRLYAGFGFRLLDHELPGSGHLGCDSWYTLEL